jgi:hypothetical protein
MAHDDNHYLVELALAASPCIKCTSPLCELARYILGTRAKPSELKRWKEYRKKQGDKGDGGPRV